MGVLPDISTIAGMRDAMVEQMRVIERDHGDGYGFGGSMYIAELTEGSLSITDAGPIGVH